VDDYGLVATGFWEWGWWRRTGKSDAVAMVLKGVLSEPVVVLGFWPSWGKFFWF